MTRSHLFAVFGVRCGEVRGTGLLRRHGAGLRGSPVAGTWHTKSSQLGSPCCSRMFLAPGWLTLPAACGQPCVPGVLVATAGAA